MEHYIIHGKLDQRKVAGERLLWIGLPRAPEVRSTALRTQAGTQ